MNYDLAEHRHRFAVWAAARAAQRGFTTVGNLRQALESTDIRAFLATPQSFHVSAAEFDTVHRGWCSSIVSSLSHHQIANVSFGRAAKLVAVYLKATVIMGEGWNSSLGHNLHPPIDRILLQGLASSKRITSPHKVAWPSINWTQLNESAYFDLIVQLRRYSRKHAVLTGAQSADAMLYDPMPGGSGLLEQLCARFADIAAAAKQVLEGCPSICERRCVDCLQTFRNGFYHRYLDRHTGAARLAEWGDAIVSEHPIPARYPSVEPSREEMPVNRAEALFRHLLTRAGMPEPEWHKQIDLGRPLNTTAPDCFWPVDEEPGLCLYMDGLSGHIHGKPATRERDRAIRETLRSMQYEVVEISATQLHDREAMVRHFSRIARILIGKDRAKGLRDDESWYQVPQST